VISVLANYRLLFQYVTNPKAINDMLTTCKISKAHFQHPSWSDTFSGPNRQTDQGNQLQKDKKHFIGCCRLKSLTNYSTSQFIDSHAACKEDFTQQAGYKCVISLHPGFKGGIRCLQIQLVATQLTDPQKSYWLMQDRVDYFAFLHHQNKHQQKKINTKTSTTKMTTKHLQKTRERQHEALKLSFLGSSSIFAVGVTVSVTYDKFILYDKVDTFPITISTSMIVGC
jgi:hypothetical protein